MTDAQKIVRFWQDAGPEGWFRKDDAFDADFRQRFLPAHEAAARGELDDWIASPTGALALMILLDQFPRNAFRDSPRMFATDAKALQLADQAIAAGHDHAVDPSLRMFFYLPYEHSESAADQQRAMELLEPLGGEAADYARIHQEIITRFGRFPHRNAILGRQSTPKELAFLADGGFAG